MTYKLEALPYDSASLEPHIDKETMEIHHGRHHNGYITNLNGALEGNAEAAALSLEDLMANISKFGPAIRNNGGGHYNHSLFWSVLTDKETSPSEALQSAIDAFGGLDKLKEEVNKAGATRFGSGWAWIIVKDGKLAVTSTPNQDNPLMDVAEVQGTPIFGIDVWEHAYYLKYQNKRPDYLGAIWNVVNWDEVSRRFAEATK